MKHHAMRAPSVGHDRAALTEPPRRTESDSAQHNPTPNYPPPPPPPTSSATSSVCTRRPNRRGSQPRRAPGREACILIARPRAATLSQRPRSYAPDLYVIRRPIDQRLAVHEVALLGGPLADLYAQLEQGIQSQALLGTTRRPHLAGNDDLLDLDRRYENSPITLAWSRLYSIAWTLTPAPPTVIRKPRWARGPFQSSTSEASPSWRRPVAECAPGRLSPARERCRPQWGHPKLPCPARGCKRTRAALCRFFMASRDGQPPCRDSTFPHWARPREPRQARGEVSEGRHCRLRRLKRPPRAGSRGTAWLILSNKPTRSPAHRARTRAASDTGSWPSSLLACAKGGGQTHVNVFTMKMKWMPRPCGHRTHPTDGPEALAQHVPELHSNGIHSCPPHGPRAGKTCGPSTPR